MLARHGFPYNSYIRWYDDSFGNLYMPIPSTPPAIRYTNNESISLSEAGTELGTVTRLEKKTITVTWNLSSDWKDQIENRCKKATSVLEFGDYSPMRVRARLISCQLSKNSEFVERTNGLWTITVQFIEV